MSKLNIVMRNATPQSDSADVRLPGRRERNRQDKLERIASSARRLFDQFGYEAVTTQQIADDADVAVGTLFLYARTKPELLLMVHNEIFRSALDAGLRHVREGPVRRSAEAIITMVDPIIEAAARQPENTVAYQRELLFGSAQERYRSEGIAIVLALEAAVAQLLANDPAEVAATAAARSIFGALHLTISQGAAGAHGAAPDRDLLAVQVEQIVAGYDAAGRL